MKAMLDKAFGILVRSNEPERSHAVQQGHSVEADQDQSPRAISSEHLQADSVLIGGACDVAEDHVLYRKNGVFLKHSGTFAEAGFPSRDSSKAWQPLQNEVAASKMDSHVLVPGYLFIASRGASFGSTLILNWASNKALTHSSTTCNTLEPADNPAARDPAEIQPCADTCLGQRGFSVSIDLCRMEVIRLFLRRDDNGSGELVVKSEDQTFKVFYFKYGGLDVLGQLLCSWSHFNHVCHSEALCYTFTVHLPKLSLSELHPMEGKLTSGLTPQLWHSLRDSDGRILDLEHLNRVIFFKGISSPAVRTEVLPIILKVYDFKSSKKEREVLQRDLIQKYRKIDHNRLHSDSVLAGIVAASYEVLEKEVYKDVLRTDRNLLYYRGDDNQNMKVQLKIMMNYLHYTGITYSQGMTDFLAPMLAALDDEVLAFSCFAKFMEISDILKDAVVNIRYQLDILRLLVEMLIPSFYSYLEQMDGGLSLMFCHRWLLVLLKREFEEQDIMMVWEACWTSADTKYFHLFICVAIIAVYGERAQKKKLNRDELMVYFNSLSLQMPLNIVMCQARGYLYRFSTSKQVDCAFHILMDNTFWQKSGSPTLLCSTCKKFGDCPRKYICH